MGRMSLAAPTALGPGISTRRAISLGGFFLAVAVLIIVVFGVGAQAGISSTFALSPIGERALNLTIPSRLTSLVIGGICAVLAGYQLTRGFGRRTNLVLGIVMFLFVFAFLTWAARDKSFSLVGMLGSTLLLAVPITFGALSGVLCERSAVINVGIEGMLLAGAFAGAFVGSVTGGSTGGHFLGGTVGEWVGLLAGAGVGALLAALLAVLAIRYTVDQIIAGVAINIIALGMTSYLAVAFLEQNDALNDPGIFTNIAIPGLDKIPLAGPVLFENNIFVYVMFALIALIYVGLFYTRWGLRVRAVGEHPRAADTVGIRVLATRYWNVILGGIVAGIGGAFFTLGSVGRFDENMTAGRGFIGLAAMIFGRWNPVGAFLAALVFGFADALQTKLSILSVPIPSEFLLMAPYLVTIAVVAGVVRKARPPAADGKPYIKE
jgi:general nucleoside transport system permease protein